MAWTRREFAISALPAAAALVGAPASARNAKHKNGKGNQMYGLISQVTTAPGRRDDLANLLLDGAQQMPGCLSYVLSADSQKEDALWITEIWTDKESHADSLRLPAVQEAIARTRSLITGFAAHAETTPIGGVGLPLPRAS